MNRFYQRPISPAWRTARSRTALVELSSMSRRPVAMTLHKPEIYGPAIEASQAFAAVGCFSFSRMTTSSPAPLRAYPSEGPFAMSLASPFGSTEPVTNHSRSIAMTKLHKPTRSIYRQAVEAQKEYGNQVCVWKIAVCWGEGDFECCV